MIAEKELTEIESRLWHRRDLKTTELLCFSIRLIESLREAKKRIKQLEEQLNENKKES